jgi:hypothetical protein
METHSKITLQAAEALIRDGFIILDDEVLLKKFRDAVPLIQKDDFDNVPVAIDGIEIQGQYNKPSSLYPRRGLYYTPKVSTYLHEDQTYITTLYEATKKVADELSENIPELHAMRGPDCLDVLNIAKYIPEAGNHLTAHTDFGAITIQYSNQPGLRILTKKMGKRQT